MPRRMAPPTTGPDGLDELLARLGVVLGKETVLYDVEIEALSGSQSDDFEAPEAPPKAPPVDFEHGLKRERAAADAPGPKTNPLRSSIQVASRSIDKNLELEIRYPRPVYFDPPKGEPKTGRQLDGAERAAGKSAGADRGEAAAVERTAKEGEEHGAAKGEGRTAEEVRQILGYGTMAVGAASAADLGLGTLGALADAPRNTQGKGRPPRELPGVEPEFMLTSAQSWREEQPFPGRDRMLWPTPDKRGPFPIGVAVEAPLPAEWYAEGEAPPAAGTVRVAVIGNGDWLVGNTLSAAKEKVLLDTCNWLLRRDDRFTRADRPWTYPRVGLDERSRKLWRWGTQVGLPGLFVYLGLTVLMVRRLR
jgi:hypothetical protein